MKSNLGKILRKLRKDKHVTIDSLADENLSKSQISRFERGESEISCIRLINLLNKLHVSLDEFLTLYNESNKNSNTFFSIVIYIRKEYALRHFDNIKALLYKPSYHLNYYETIMIKSIINTFDDTISPSEKELHDLTDYLFKIESFGYYEIILLGNSVKLINYSTLFLLTKETLKHYKHSSSKRDKELVTELAINCLMVSIDKGAFHNSDYLIKEISKLLVDEFFYYERTIFLYACGYLDFKRGISSGKEKMQKAIQVLEILDDSKIATYYKENYNKVLKEKTGE